MDGAGLTPVRHGPLLLRLKYRDPTVTVMARAVLFVVFDRFQILDLTGPLAAFEAASGFVAGAYAVTVVSSEGGLVRASGGLQIQTERFADPACDTLMVAGGAGSLAAGRDDTVRDFVLQAARAARRTASVCSGSAILAAAGLLDGRRATTHWRRARGLQRLFPVVKVVPDRIFVKDGAVWTSAGISAGIDLALALIEEDLGVDVAAACARELVVYHRRPGGQSQFSTLIDLKPTGAPSARALSFARERLGETLTVDDLAAEVGLSPRQFARRFLAETGQTPAKAVERLRVEAARSEVETGLVPIDQIARRHGFGDPERMRRAFLRAFGQPPQALRRLARAG
jgi:transcriptional regulator GlxA family with amidase domain